MGENNVKLLGTKLSPFSHRIEWALKLKGIEYEFVVEDLKNKSLLLLELNPVYKKVPVLIHGGKVIAESLVILEYIDETWKDNYPILPKCPEEKAYARFWAKIIDEKLIGSANMALYSTEGDQAKALESMAEALQLLDGEMERNRRNLFGGEGIGFLDIMLGWIYWFKFGEEAALLNVTNPDKYPAFASWFRKFLEVPLIKENLPSPSELHRVCQTLQMKWLDKMEGTK